MVGRERQLVAAARSGAVDHANGEQARGLACVLDAVACFVGELAEIDLVGVAGGGGEADVGAGAENPPLAPAARGDLCPRAPRAPPARRGCPAAVGAPGGGGEVGVVALRTRT